MLEFFGAMLHVCHLWIGLAAIHCGLGLLLRRAFGLRDISTGVLFTSFWLGWAVSIVALQAWHLLAPIGLAPVVLMALLAAAGLVWSRGPLASWGWRLLRTEWPGVLLCAALLLWVANRALGPLTLFDTGLYHLPAIRWASEHALLPGIGNLHGRLAFNSAHFLYGAAVESLPGQLRAVNVVNGLLYLVLLVQIVHSTRRLLDAEGAQRRYHLFLVLLLAPVVAELYGRNVASVSPDTPIFALGVVLAAALLRMLQRRVPDADVERFALFSVLLLSAAGVSVKLSFAIYGGTASALAIGLYLLNHRAELRRAWRPLAGIAAVPLLVILLWMGRGVVQSGYPLYPSTLLALDVSWRVPVPLANNDSFFIQSWARHSDAHWSEVLGKSDWLTHWLRFMVEPLFKVLQVTLIGVLFAVLWRRRDDGGRARWRPWIALLPAALSLVAWLVLAPDYRFAGASFWIVCALVLALCYCELCERTPAAPRLLDLVLALLLFLYISPLERPILEAPHKGTEVLHKIPEPELRTRQVNGVAISVPVKKGQCWDAPLPCTPRVLPTLGVRREEEKLRGFFHQGDPLPYLGVPVEQRLITSPPLRATLISGKMLAKGRWRTGAASPDQVTLERRAKLWVYAEEETTALLELLPRAIQDPSGERGHLQLKVLLDNQPAGELALEVGPPARLDLPLPAGSSVITFETDPKDASVTLGPLRLTTRSNSAH